MRQQKDSQEIKKEKQEESEKTIRRQIMCTAATYKTKDFYMGRTLDYECSYGEEVTITPRNYEFIMRHGQPYQT